VPFTDDNNTELTATRQCKSEARSQFKGTALFLPRGFEPPRKVAVSHALAGTAFRFWPIGDEDQKDRELADLK
jgi:hypothetical protein